ncbi:SDR family NAD(P)-dependent oxidoreductase [Seongchinamella sediminis]|uniref:SDR family NAD(P)-dependent oxidoreductase n=1 Tax=Seongchinamella sediminis TaxID=2283635 RepID=A0A3L7DZM5_9GAMM|nr:SDR family oxidoreductase [Seongchinamella sediminis]RLQ21441.1 SDR family NAD(P)-dependent oxidoreductase [Seongchinamella sediminis]
MTVLVTGANRGIGLELARQLTEQGHQVIGTARKPAEASELKALGAKVMQLDVTDPESVAALAADMDDQPIDLLINNAGTGGQAPGSFEDTDFERVKLTFEVNSLGPMRVTQALLPNVLASVGKTVVHISSIMGSIASNQGGYYGYRASKAALNMFNSSLALELADRGVTAVVLHPGWVQTRMGGSGADISVDVSVAGLLKVISSLGPGQSGRFYDYQGRELPW